MSAQRIASKSGSAPYLLSLDLELSVDIKHDDALLAVRITGELDMATAVILQDAMRPYQGLHTPVSYDLTELTFIDCAGLRALLTPAGGDPFSGLVSISSASRGVRRLLELLRLELIVDT